MRLALRSLAKSPGFTATVVLTLALGIGACTVMFSAIDGVLLHTLPGPHPERLVTLATTRPPAASLGRTSAADFLDWVAQARSFAAITAFAPTSLNLTGEGEPLRLNAARISRSQFEVLGLPPALGRSFTAEECTRGGNTAVVLGYDFWQRAFAGAPGILGRKILLNGEPGTIVGVAHPQLGRLTDAANTVDVYVPLSLAGAELSRRSARQYLVLARLKPDVTLERARVEMDTIAARLAAQYPDTNKGVGVFLAPAGEFFTRALRPVLWSLFGAVLCVLLIVCANVANLLLVRAAARHREFAIRAALGASRGRLVRQLLVESVLLALLGGGAGVLLAIWGLAALQGYTSAAGLGRLAALQLDPTALGFALGLSLLTGMLFGLAPAWSASRVDLQDAVKQGSRSVTDAGSSGRLRHALVVLEIAGAVLLLNTAGLLVRSFVTLSHVDPGFEPGRVAVLQLFLRGPQYAVNETFARRDPVLAFSDRVLARFRSLPGVEAAGVTLSLPFVNDLRGQTRPFVVDGRAVPAPTDRPAALWATASPDYFRAMGIPLRRGRLFTEHDRAGSTPVVLISETLARQHFPGEDPLGRRIDIDTAPEPRGWREIVGVVADVNAGALGEPVPPQVYEPWAQAPATMLTFAVRTAGNPAAILSALKPQVYAVDGNQPVAFVRPLAGFVDGSTATRRFTVHLLGLFSAIAVVIAAIGIYGVMAFRASQRTREIGIRMALGARAADVLRQMLGHGMKAVAAGLALGLLATFLLGRAIESLLFATSARDPLTLAVTGLLLAAAGLVACWLPARRAARVDPMIALRAE